MTTPRQIIPGRTYLITRRCTQRHFFLVPDAETQQVFEYCFAEAAARFGVDTNAWIAMSDHYHAVVHDHAGNLPEFLAHFHKMIAKVLNDRWGRTENLWSNQPCSVVHLVEDRDVIDAVVYVLCNPRAQGIVDRIEDWPGASSYDGMNRPSRLVHRPARFFRKRGRMPEAVGLRAVAPPGWGEREVAWRALVQEAVKRRERALGGRRLAWKERCALRLRASSVSHATRATSPERVGQRRPVIACKNPQRRQVALEELRGFRRMYDACVRRFLNGERLVVFPAGTYRLRQFCRPPRESPPRTLMAS